MRWWRIAFSILAAIFVACAGAPLPAQPPWFRRVINLLRPIPVAEKAEGNVDAGDAEEPPSIVLPENGELRRKLDQLRQQIEGGHHAEAAGQLGRLLQDPEIRDFFLSRDDERRGGRSFQAEIRRLLHELPEPGQTAYRVQFEPIARARLNAAMAQNDAAALRDVALRFPNTRPGDEAWYRLGHWFWDHGRAGAAAVCLEQLSTRPEAAAPFEPTFSRLLTACRDRLGTSSPTTREDWLTYRGNGARNRSVAAREPFLAPRWSLPVCGEAHTELAIDRAWQAYRDGTATALPMLSPLAVGDLVLMRTARGVAAFDLQTGRFRWRHPSDDEDDNAGLDHILWQEPAGGAFSADEECVYLLEDARGVAADMGAPGHPVLSAREHLESREGKLRWQVGGADGGAEPRLAGAAFLGPPLSWHDRLYVLVELRRTLSLAVLDRATGRRDWTQDLAQIEEAAADDRARLPGGTMPSIAGEEILICPTSGGAVVAVDLPTQSLLWAYRYPRRAPGPNVDTEAAESAPRLDQFDRWLDATVTIGDECAVLAPSESREIHCLDLKTGEPRWRKPRGDGLFVACLTGDLAVIAGRRQMTALRLIDGAVSWKRACREKSLPAGRGVLAGQRYFLPMTSATILEVDLTTGAVAAEHKSPRELPAGNLIWHRGLFVSQSPFALEAFDEREQLAAEIQARLQLNPRDADALIRRGELDLAARRIPEAIAAFRTAHENSHSAKTRSRLVSALLEAVRLRLPDSEKFAAELDDLLGP